MPKIIVPTAIPRIVLLLLAVFPFLTTGLRADDSPLQFSVGLPSTADDSSYLSTLGTQPAIPCLIHITNLSSQTVTLPNFSRDFAPITAKTTSTWIYPPKFTAQTSPPQNLVIKPGETVIASRDLQSLIRFQMFGTYSIQYTLDADYTFFPLTTVDTPPSSYTSHHISTNGSFDVPISVSQSILGWPIIFGSVGLVAVIIIVIAFFMLTHVPRPKADSWSSDFSLSDSLEKDKD